METAMNTDASTDWGRKVARYYAHTTVECLRREPATARGEQADAAMVYLLDRSGLEFTLVGGVGLCQGDHVGMRVANRDDTLPGHVLRHGTVVAEMPAGSAAHEVMAAALGQTGVVA